ncbi:MAG: CocE/NonD family hydrolase [Lewinella sp.]|nr:CocE/NonD family hydrolase [Lewinella sp.]
MKFHNYLHTAPYFIPVLLGLFILSSCHPQQKTLYDIELRETWIPMPDGTRLAADLYLPKTDKAEKFPVLLEYLPYRKDEGRKLRYSVFSYFVQRGYVVARVDIRGTGRSEGQLIAYEYTDQEQEDGEVIIDWLSKQDFSNGAVGMFGISWGGFNSIQIAMRQPPTLKAILAMMATDDIYEDDVHFMDGMMHVDAYEIGRDIENVIPGAPDYEIDEDYFAEKFDTKPWLLLYKRQQRDGPFWDRASLNSNYDALQTPIFMISGWYDGYRDSTPRIFQNVNAPKKAIIGPWNHTFPNMAEPPPSIEWRHEAVRWFDYWLKGEKNGIMEEPPLVVYMREGHGPDMPEDTIGGSWVGLDNWPSPAVEEEVYYLTRQQGLDALADERSSVQELEYKASSGIEASGSVMWWGDWSPDQKKTDAHSLVFETAPLAKDLVILGFPQVHLKAAVSAEQAHFLSRLSDVAPDSAVTLITGAGFNGAHRNSSRMPEKLAPGQYYPLDIEMHFTSWTFKKGHRIRLSLSNGQWPMIWPNPSNLNMTVQLGGEDGSTFSLPIFNNDPDLIHPKFLPPANDPELPGFEVIQSGTVSGFAEISETEYDPKTGITRVIASNGGETVYPWATWVTTEKIVHQVNDREPATASVTSEYTILVKTPERQLKWIGLLDLSSDAANFYYDYTRKLMEGDSLIREKQWKETIPRDFQ